MAQRLKVRAMSYRMKQPVNPSVRGTGKQSRRDKKGDNVMHALMQHGEGSGQPGGHGRGGKASR